MAITLFPEVAAHRYKQIYESRGGEDRKQKYTNVLNLSLQLQF